VLPERTTEPFVAVLGPLGEPVRGREVEPGVWLVEGLPAGRWTLFAKARGPDGWLRVEDFVDVGEEGEVTIELQ
jgi:hypothetical protein